jgi:hypothetical protein
MLWVQEDGAMGEPFERDAKATGLLFLAYMVSVVTAFALLLQWLSEWV